MLKRELEGTHISQGRVCVWEWFGASARVSLKSTQLLARAPGDVKRSARSTSFFKRAVVLQRAHRSLYKPSVKMFFCLRRNLCLG